MPSSPDEVRRALIDRARELGLDRIGICSADLPPEAAEFDRWLARSFHGEMQWMAAGRERRLDPARILPGARSFVVGALACPPAEAAPPAGGDPPRGRVARFARGEDYHRILLRRLRELALLIQDLLPGHRALEYVDTGAILERMWAARAGIGWIGKNAMVLNRAMGSHFSLGVIVTTASLPADEPAWDQCGACTLCIEACPTGAIVEDRTVDSRRCLSYHTIELRGALPDLAREAIGDRLLGCDDCQDACPWNRPEAAEAAGPGLLEVMGQDFEAWDRRFARSAVRRATWAGLRRNAIAALAHHEGEPETRASWIERLSSLASDPSEDPVIREQAAWSAERLRRRD